MWISRLEISNYKKASTVDSISIEFKDGLNVIVGENNVGKTTIAETLALCLNYGSPDRNVWLTEQDFHDPLEPISFRLEFSGLSDVQQAAFLRGIGNWRRQWQAQTEI
jgi:putative ATP-dependent endonuclease of the OLD family